MLELESSLTTSLLRNFLPKVSAGTLIESSVTPLQDSSSWTLVKYVGSGNPKQLVPPERDVLWCIPAQTVVFVLPVVTEVPTVKISFLSNASFNKPRIFNPSLLYGRKAFLCVP